MWCPSPRGGKGDTTAIGFTALMAAVSSWIGDPTSLDHPIDSNSSSAIQNYSSDDAASMSMASSASSSAESTSTMQDQAEGYCENNIINSDWEWHCGTEIIVWTSVKPEDLFAIAALFTQADLMMRNLHCPDDQYPIKAIIGGDGIVEGDFTPILEEYLQDLRRAGLMPGETWFDMATQLLPGPRPPTGIWDADVDAVAAWTEADLESLPENQAERRGSMPSAIKMSFENLVEFSMDSLVELDAPIFIALRPILEYAVLWSETTRLSGAETFRRTEEYMDHRVSAWEEMARDRNENPAGLAKAAMKAFKRSRIILTVAQLENMGSFFGYDILDANSDEHRMQEIRNFEEIFLTLPRQALLVEAKDKYGYQVKANDRYGVGSWGHDPLFTASLQAAVFERLRAVPEASTRLLKYVALWNVPTKTGTVWDVRTRLTDVSSKRVTVERFNELVTQSSRLSTELVEGTVLDDDVDIRTWKQAVHALRRDIVSFKRRITGNDRHNRNGLAVWAKKTIRAYDEWAGFALHQASFVETPNLLVPFFVGPRHWQVRDSIVQVSYGGRRYAEDGYHWGTTDIAQSTIWLARTSDLENGHQSTERWAEIRHDVEQLYCEAFDPNFESGNCPGG